MNSVEKEDGWISVWYTWGYRKAIGYKYLLPPVKDVHSPEMHDAWNMGVADGEGDAKTGTTSNI